MKKSTFFKMFLVMAGLCTGNSVWGGDKTVVKYSFDDALSPSLSAGDHTTLDYSHTSVITSTLFLNATCNSNNDPKTTTVSLGSTDLSGETWTLTFEWAGNGGCNAKVGHTILKAGETNLFDISDASSWNTTNTISYGESGSTTIPVAGCSKSNRFSINTANDYNTTTYWHHFVITGSTDGGVKMTVTNSSTGTKILDDVTLSETNVNPTSLTIEPSCGGAVGIDELSLTYHVEGEVVQNPTVTYTNVDGINRTLTATCETEGATIQHSTDGTNYEDGASVVVSASGTVYFKAVKESSESEVVEFEAEAGTEITLNAPTISRTNDGEVTITADQTNKLLSPTATIYYSYDGSNEQSFTGSKTITIAADATISARAEATGYTSASSERAVALFPAAGVTEVENATYTTSYSNQTLTDEAVTVSERDYAALKLDDTRWGSKILLQTSGWGIRTNGGWYVNSSGTVYILMPEMKAGDIIVADVDKKADVLINAVYSEKYTYNNRHAYIVTADGSVELGFTRVSSKVNNYIRGFYAYTHTVIGTAIGATDNSTAYLAAATDQVSLKPGDSYRYQFINYNNSSSLNWQNWVLPVYDESANRVLTLRADWYEDQNGTTIAEHQRGFSTDAANYWDNVPSKMNGATVDMTVSFTADKNFVMTSTFTYEETTWTYNFTSDNENNVDLTSNDYINVALSVSKSWLDLTSEGRTSVGITIGATGYSTFASACALDLSSLPEGLTAYYASAVGESSVTLTQATGNVAAGEGLILKGAANATYSIPVVASGEAIDGNMLVGCTEATEVAANKYVLASNNGTAEFQYLSTALTIPAGKAYLDYDYTNNAKLRVIFDGDASGIEEIATEAAEDGVLYNVAGQVVTADYKGIVIKNGKKYLNQ